MSGALGRLPYPIVDPAQEEAQNPLRKYMRQLDPLGKVADPLWQTPATPPLPTMRSPLGEPGLPALQNPPAAMGQQMARRPRPWADEATRSSAAALLSSMGLGGAQGGAQQPAAVAPGASTLAQVPVTPAAPAAAPAAPEEPPIPLPEDAPEQSQSQSRISTRIPSAAQQRKFGFDAHETPEHEIDYDSMKAAPEALEKNANLIKAHYPGFEHLRTSDPHKINEAFITHAADNLKWLYNKMNDEKGPIGPGIVERAKRWYSGANKIAHSLAKEFNVKPYQAAAVLAALSPQKDWYQNVHLARKVFEAHQLGHNWTMTPEMRAYSDKYIGSLEGDEKNPKNIAKLRGLQEKFQTTPMAQLTDPFERAVFSRWHDEAHNPRDYQMVTPEGEMAGTSMIPAKYTKKGALKEAARPRNVSWGSFNEIAKATAALQNASLPEVSRLMGGNHKVRNFFNNIIAPLHGKDVTIDTHAIAAALLRPLGGGHMAVGHGLGTSAGKGVPGAANNGTLGNRGMYGLYAEAYRRAAKDLGILPRELQSVTWEGIRGLFSPEQKRNKDFVAHIDNIWRNKGQFRGLTPDERRERIAAHAGGLKLPSWAGGTDYGDDEG